MTTIIITEKTSQKKDLAAAIGNEYGQIFPAEGHLLSLKEPQSVNEQWGKWSFDLLKPDDFYPTCPAPDASPSAMAKLKAIENAIKKATKVIIATDCDREGQLIGEELLRHYEFKGPVERAMFTAQDEKTLREAFANLEPNNIYNNLGQAAMVRQQADQVYNLSLTRAATVALKQPGEYGAIGIGRVKTPTMAIVCIRELEIQNFTPLDYYHLVATANTDVGTLLLRHAPKERILKEADAEIIRAAAEGYEGPLSAQKKIKKTKPPKLLDLPELQKICSRKWGWSATKTLDVAQELYDGDGKKIQTYPRAESRYLSENQIDDVPDIIAGLKNLPQYESLQIGKPEIRKGKSGHFSDAGLKGVSHHAIVPNKNTMDRIHSIYPRLSSDEAKMFDLVASSYLAILMPDYVYESTTVAMDVPGPDGKNLPFKITGNIPKELGWKVVFTDEMEKKEDHAGELPPVQDGQIARLDPVEMDTKKTKAPPRFNEGSLIDAMQNAWRFVEDKDIQERLKEAKGIGTPATRATVISGLKRQNFLTQSGKNIVPTPSALTLYKTFKSIAPELVDPGVTALWEMKLDDVLMGEQTARQVWDEIGDATSRLIGIIRDNASKAPKISTGIAAPKGATKFGSGKPTDKMVATAKSIAEKKKVKLPKGFSSDFQACKDFLDEHLGGNPLIAIEKRLGSGIIKGIGPAAAKTLMTAFGAEVFKIIDETPERLSDVKGIGPKIVQAALDKKATTEIGKTLQSHGVASNYALRLQKTYGEETLSIISNDPYRIIRDVKWFGFENCDRIAKNIGLLQDTPTRLQAALYHATNQSFDPREKEALLSGLASRLSVSIEQLEDALNAEIEAKNLYIVKINSKEHIGKSALQIVTKGITSKLKSFVGGETPWPEIQSDKAISWAEGQISQQLSAEQRSAVETALRSKMLMLKISPGVDCSICINVLLRVLKAKGIKPLLATPTAKEAALLNEQIEGDADSALNLLDWKTKTGKFKYSSKKPFDCGLLIIKNAHSIEPPLMLALLHALPKDAALILTSDLPKHANFPTKDLIEKLCASEKIPTFSLTELPEDLAQSARLSTLHALTNSDALPTGSASTTPTDFFKIKAKSNDETIAKTIEIIQNRLPSRFEFDAIDDITVICPAAGGVLGSNQLNQRFQQSLNPPKDNIYVDRFGWRYRANDKVIMQENDYEKGLMAGQIGRIKKIQTDSQNVTINFSGKSIEFQYDELDTLSLGFAVPAQLAHYVENEAVIAIDTTAKTQSHIYHALYSARKLAIVMG
ncbi:MAG: AAA family ATPase [Sneathiella sp.]|nr:AAA family ATPase [Sneathiella sp.]